MHLAQMMGLLDHIDDIKFEDYCNHEFVDCSVGGKPLIWCKKCGKEQYDSLKKHREKEKDKQTEE